MFQAEDSKQALKESLTDMKTRVIQTKGNKAKAYQVKQVRKEKTLTNIANVFYLPINILDFV